jgi:ribosome-associated toxin RatA of RatAB toxin-antitoxin module
MSGRRWPVCGHHAGVRFAASLALAASVLAAANACSADELAVRVERRGDLVVIDVEATVAAPVRDAWSVLTDYEHMASFVSNLKSSNVLSRNGNSLEVSQTGETKVAFMRFSFAVVRAVELVPMQEIRSTLVKGDFKSYEASTRIIDQRSHLLIVHHGEYVPKAWLPPMVGMAVIKSETHKQFGELVAEILRRKVAAPAD